MIMKEYRVKLILKNKRELKRHLKNLKKEYRNIPIEKALDFDFQWNFKKSPTNTH